MNEPDTTITEDIEREFADLAAALRADAPQASDQLAHDLGERVRAGFPRGRRLPRLLKPRRPPTPVLAAAVSAAAALAVVVAINDGDGGGRTTSDTGNGGGRSQVQSPPGASSHSGAADSAERL